MLVTWYTARTSTCFASSCLSSHQRPSDKVMFKGCVAKYVVPVYTTTSYSEHCRSFLWHDVNISSANLPLK